MASQALCSYSGFGRGVSARDLRAEVVKTERETNLQRLLDTENKLRVDGGRGWGMGIKKGTCRDEHWGLYVSDEPLGPSPETNTTLHVN